MAMPVKLYSFLPSPKPYHMHPYDDREYMWALMLEDPNFRLIVPEGQDFYDMPAPRNTNRSLYLDIAEPERTYYAKKPARLIIYPKDVAIIYGKSERFGRNLLQTIRESFGKTKNMPITIPEFCHYTGIDPETVHNFIMES
jgi:hypothetical protein